MPLSGRTPALGRRDRRADQRQQHEGGSVSDKRKGKAPAREVGPAQVDGEPDRPPIFSRIDRSAEVWGHPLNSDPGRSAEAMSQSNVKGWQSGWRDGGSASSAGSGGSLGSRFSLPGAAHSQQQSGEQDAGRK